MSTLPGNKTLLFDAETLSASLIHGDGYARLGESRRKLWAVAYQIAGSLLLAPDALTEGQRERLTELLLNILSEPDRFKASTALSLHRSAMKP